MRILPILILLAAASSLGHAQALNPESLPHKGKVFFQRPFSDKGGQNLIFAAQVQHEEEMRSDLYVYHYAQGAGKPELLWDIQDFGTPLCDMVLHEQSLQVIDLDHDGYMEACFIYQQRCDGLDPYATKLMLHSRGQKYAIRGKVAVEDGQELERNIDASLEAKPAFRAFAVAEWAEFVREGATPTSKFAAIKGSDWVLMGLEDMMASGGIGYALVDRQWGKLPVDPAVEKALASAADVSALPELDALLYLSLGSGVGVYAPKTRTHNSLMTFLGDTEGLSQLAWSPDGKKVAFVSMNRTQYPKGCRIFVLTLAGGKMIRKEKYDADVFFMAASDYVLEPVVFVDNGTIEYVTRDQEGQGMEGPKERIVLEK